MTALAYELNKSGLKVQTQVGMPLVYDKIKMDVGYNRLKWMWVTIGLILVYK